MSERETKVATYDKDGDESGHGHGVGRLELVLLLDEQRVLAPDLRFGLLQLVFDVVVQPFLPCELGPRLRGGCVGGLQLGVQPLDLPLLLFDRGIPFLFVAQYFPLGVVVLPAPERARNVDKAHPVFWVHVPALAHDELEHAREWKRLGDVIQRQRGRDLLVCTRARTHAGTRTRTDSRVV